MARKLSARHPVSERRGPNRPTNGDIRVCPQCGGAAEFNERYRFAGKPIPAWVCDTAACVPSTARAADGTHKERIRASQPLQAAALRAVMISRSQQKRTLNEIARTQSLIDRRRKRP